MTEKDIIKALFEYNIGKRGHKHCASNTQAIFGVGEADFVTINRKKMLSEFEIKISRSDFKADFRNKPRKHLNMKMGTCEVNYFYFVCPENLIHPEEVPQHAGLIYVGKYDHGAFDVYSVKKAKRLHSNPVNEKIKDNMFVSVMHKFYRNL